MKAKHNNVQRWILIRFANGKEYRAFQRQAYVSMDDFALAECFASS